jgi:hypothetical protein
VRAKEFFMTVVPVSLLSASDLSILGNNFAPRRRPARRFSVAAINRSLAVHDEKIDRLYRRGVGSERLRTRHAA